MAQKTDQIILSKDSIKFILIMIAERHAPINGRKDEEEALKIFRPLMMRFANQDEWDLNQLMYKYWEYNRLARDSYINNDHVRWLNNANIAFAYGIAHEVVTGEIENLQKISESMKIIIPELEQWEKENPDSIRLTSWMK